MGTGEMRAQRVARSRGSQAISSKRSIRVALSSVGSDASSTGPRGAGRCGGSTATASRAWATSASSRCCCSATSWARGACSPRAERAGERDGVGRAHGCLSGRPSAAVVEQAVHPEPVHLDGEVGRDHVGLREPLQTEARWPCTVSATVSARTSIGSSTSCSAAQRSRAPPIGLEVAVVDGGEARAVLGVAQHIGPELQEHRQPAVLLALAAGAMRGGDGQQPGRCPAPRRACAAARAGSARPGARRRRRTGPPWTRSSSRPRPSCSRPRRPPRRATSRGSPAR